MDRHSGILRVVQPLDRETLAVHHFVILVTDRVKEFGGADTPQVHSATASIEVRILDVNDSPPFFIEPRPVANIPEDNVPGTLVMRLTAVSMDEGENAIVHYRLLETETPEFTLNSTTGESQITSPFHLTLLLVCSWPDFQNPILKASDANLLLLILSQRAIFPTLISLYSCPLDASETYISL